MEEGGVRGYSDFYRRETGLMVQSYREGFKERERDYVWVHLGVFVGECLYVQELGVEFRSFR